MVIRNVTRFGAGRLLRGCLVFVVLAVSPEVFPGDIPAVLAAAPAISVQEAVTVVENLPEVRNLLGRSVPYKHKVILHEEEPQRYVLRLVMFLPAEAGLPPRTTTVAWYAVDKATGVACTITPGLD